MAQSGDESNSNRDRIEWLAEQIAYHSDLYYNQAKTEISDAEFDTLWDELKLLDIEQPLFAAITCHCCSTRFRFE